MGEEQEGLSKALNATIPKSLDDIIRAHKEEFILAQVDEFSLSTCVPECKFDPVKGKIAEARIVSWRVSLGEYPPVTIYKILGYNNGQVFSTSNVVCYKKMENGRIKVKTANSTYEVEFTERELDFHLLAHLCVMINRTGFGEYFQVPNFYY